MINLLYEPQSIRSDGGILYITERESCTLPFIFSVQSADVCGNAVVYNIESPQVIEFVIKKDVRSPQTILKKRVTNIKNNMCVLELSSNDIAQLWSGKQYVLSAVLYDSKGNLIRTLIKQLPVIVQEVA